MRVLIVNTSERSGGAAVAANRLKYALNNNGVKAKMLVRDKETDDITVVSLPQSWRLQWHFLWERFCVFIRLHFHRKHLFEVDIANAGSDITHLPEFKEADVIHLHWINQGMLSLNGLSKILRSGKPVVWTMHDFWPCTAICHLPLGCEAFQSHCSHCRLLPGGGGDHDLADKLWRRKRAAYSKGQIQFVTCSRYLGNMARKSQLLTGFKVTSIPNPIDTRVFHPGDRAAARQLLHLPADKHIILFVSQRATNELKGMSYLEQALQMMVEKRPQTKDDTCVAVLGGHSEEVVDSLPVPAFPLGYVSDEKSIVNVYNAADVFVLPSLQENLPNTIMEAMACGVPCVGFYVGGIPEMIDHLRNGYVARYRDAADLCEGLNWTLFVGDREQMSKSAVSKVAASYSERLVAMKYIEVYNQALAYKNYHI